MRYLFSILLILGFQSSIFAQSQDEKIILKILADQTAAWNAGDLVSFMQGYWKSDSLIFIGKNGPEYGYGVTLENYKKSYPDTVAMGKLNFNIIQVKRLSAIYFSVVGKWHLTRTIGDQQGHFTLLIKKIGKQWKIVSDHSS